QRGIDQICPLWVKSRHLAVQSPCPLYPQKRTCAVQLGMSAKGQKRTSPYSISSSALVSSEGGISSPSAFAVLRLTISSNLVGCSTGRSPGLAPFKILSTYVATRRQLSSTLGPYDTSPPASTKARSS